MRTALFDEKAIFGQVADEGVIVGKLKMGLHSWPGLLDQSANVTQTPGTVRKGARTGLVDRLERIFVRQAHQPHQRANGPRVRVVPPNLVPSWHRVDLTPQLV